MSWQHKAIGDFLTESNVESNVPSAKRRIRVRLNTEGVEKRPLTSEITGATRYFQRSSGQFIYGKQNLHKGAFGVIPEELDGFESSSDLPAFDVADGLRPRWLEYFLKQGDFYKSLVSIARGAATKRIQPQALFEVKFPVPSLKVQDEIIARMDSCASVYSNLENELTYQQSLLTKLKQAILQEAIQGKLTTDWRTKNPDAEPASRLLKRIRAEKTRLIAEKKIRKENPQRKPSPEITPDEIPFKIPKGWEWCRFSAMSINRDSERKPIRKTVRERKKKIYPYYGASGRIDKIDGFTHDGRFLLIGEDGSNLRLRSTPLAFEAKGKIWVNNHAHVIQFTESILQKFTKHCINGMDISEFITGGFQPKLNQANLNRIPFPLPPLTEQAIIVNRVEALLKICHTLETEINHSSTQATQLFQATLKQAFSQT